MVTVNEQGIPLAPLARMAKHDAQIGNTANPRLADNLGKTLAETMNDREIYDRIYNEVAQVRSAYKAAKRGNIQMGKTLSKLRDNFLIPNLNYLREIGRLPSSFAKLDPAVEFAH